MLPKTPDRLTFGTLLGLLNLRGLYTLGFSLIFGMCESTQVTEFNKAHSHPTPYSTMDDIHWR